MLEGTHHTQRDTTRLRSFAARDALLVVLGMSLFWPCIKEVPLYLANLASGEAVGRVATCFTGLTLYVLAVVAGLSLARRTRIALFSPTSTITQTTSHDIVSASNTDTVSSTDTNRPAKLLAFYGIVGVVGAAASMLRLGSAPLPVLVAMIVGMGLFVGVSLEAWTDRLARLDVASIPLAIAVSFALAELYKLVLGLVGATDAWFVFPVASTVLLIAALCTAGSNEGATVATAATATDRSSAQAPAQSRPSLAGYPWKALVPYLGFVVLWSALLGFSSEGAVGSMSGADRIWAYVVTFIGLALVASFLAWRLVEGDRHPVLLYPLAATVLCYMAVLVFMLFDQSLDFGFFKRALVAAEAVLGALVFIQLATPAIEGGFARTGLLALYAAIYNGGAWMVLGELFKAVSNVSVSFMSGPFAMVALFASAAILTGFLLWFAASTLAEARLAASMAAASASPDPTAGTGDGNATSNPVRAALDAIVAKAGLTKREAEVMELLCRGYSGKRIAEDLCISDHTVHFHTDAVYRKLGVHSKQELIAYVERRTG